MFHQQFLFTPSDAFYYVMKLRGDNMNPQIRARIAASVVEVVGWIQIVVGSLVGVVAMVTTEYPCKTMRDDYSCARYAYAWETADWYLGLLLIPSSIVVGSFIIMIAAYVNYRTTDRRI
jgi:hypothetical protein